MRAFLLTCGPGSGPGKKPPPLPDVHEPYVPDAATLAAAEAEAKLAKVKVGDAFPAGVSLDVGFPPEKLNVADYCKGKKVVLVGLPGAFTPT
jgi:hypothetical protein